jgi:dihydroxyacetone kinase-like predicted kinase
VAALLAYNPERDVDETVAVMTEALEAVSSGEITTAQRTVSLNGVEAQAGQTIGMLDGKLVAAGDGEADVLADLLRTAGVEDELVTLYWGGDLEEGAAAEAAEAVEPGFPEAEFELVHGGQPHYHFLVSIET